MKGDEEYRGGGAYHAFLKLFNEHFVEEQKKKKEESSHKCKSCGCMPRTDQWSSRDNRYCYDCF